MESCQYDLLFQVFESWMKVVMLNIIILSGPMVDGLFFQVHSCPKKTLGMLRFTLHHLGSVSHEKTLDLFSGASMKTH